MEESGLADTTPHLHHHAVLVHLRGTPPLHGVHRGGTPQVGHVAGPPPALWSHLAVRVEAPSLSEGEDTVVASLRPAARGAGPGSEVSVGGGVDGRVMGGAAGLRVVRQGGRRAGKGGQSCIKVRNYQHL